MVGQDGPPPCRGAAYGTSYTDTESAYYSFAEVFPLRRGKSGEPESTLRQVWFRKQPSKEKWEKEDQLMPKNQTNPRKSQ